MLVQYVIFNILGTDRHNTSLLLNPIFFTMAIVSECIKYDLINIPFCKKCLIIQIFYVQDILL